MHRRWTDFRSAWGHACPLVNHSGEYLSIPYSTNSALYAGAIRRQQEEIEQLEKEIKEIKERAYADRI